MRLNLKAYADAKKNAMVRIERWNNVARRKGGQTHRYVICTTTTGPQRVPYRWVLDL